MTAVATTEDHARRWAERARLDLEAAADRGESGLSKIRTAITERHDEALGYRSLGDYLRTEYADALGNVCRVFGVEFRRQVVAELTEAGLSTRAIAPVVGVSKSQVATDVQVSSSGHVDTETGEVSDDYLPDDATGEEVTSDAPLPQTSEARPRGERGASHESANGSDVDDAGTTELAPPPAPRPSVVGLDGKTYARPIPRLDGRTREEADADRKHRERQEALIDLYSDQIGKALLGIGTYGHRDDPASVMAEFAPAHLNPPQMDRAYDLDNLKAARRFIDALIAWKEQQ
jgi:transposase-like protein